MQSLSTLRARSFPFFGALGIFILSAEYFEITMQEVCPFVCHLIGPTQKTASSSPIVSFYRLICNVLSCIQSKHSNQAGPFNRPIAPQVSLEARQLVELMEQLRLTIYSSIGCQGKHAVWQFQ